jgi:hypothetical protein
MTAVEKAEAASSRIEKLRNDYLEALRQLNDCGDRSVQVRLPLIRAVWDKAVALYNAVEQVIVQTDLLKLHESSVWATDLAATACNVLETIPVFYTKMGKEYSAIDQTCPKASGLAYYSMQAVVPIYHPNSVVQLRKAFEAARLPTSGFDRPHKMTPRFSAAERWTGIVTGIALVACMLTVAIVLKPENYNGFNLWVFRIVTSLGVGIIGGTFVPGLFNVTHTTAKTVVRATGGCAFFFVSLYINPPKFVIQDIRNKSEMVSSPDGRVQNNSAGGK